MADASQLFDLAASISVNTSQSDKALDNTEKKVKSLTSEFKKLDKQVGSIGKSGSAGGGSRGSDVLADLKAQFAQARTEVDALKQKTAALGQEGASGMTQYISSLVAAVGPVAALGAVVGATAAANLYLHKTLLQLAVDTAAQSAGISNLSKQYTVSVQRIQAAQILATQTGRSLNDVLTESNVTLDIAQERFQTVGAIMSDEMVASGKALNDQIVLLTAQWTVFEAKLGSTVIPHVSRLMAEFGDVIERDKSAIDLLAGAVGMLAGFFESNLTGAINQARTALILLEQQFPAVFALAKMMAGIGSAAAVGPQKSISDIPWEIRVAQAATVKGPDYSGVKGLFKSTGGGGRGGGGAAKADAGAQLLKQLEREITDLMPKRVMWERLMGEEYKKTADSIKKKIYVLDLEISAQKKINDLTRERIATGIEEREEFQKFVDLVQQSLTRARTVSTRQRRAGTSPIGDDEWIDLGGGSRVRRTRDESAPPNSRPRIATVNEQIRREQMQKIREQAAQLSSVITNALSEGFHNGMKAGLRSFTEGIMQMIESAALKAFEAKLTEIFTKAMGGGSGNSGSIAAKIATILLGSGGGSGGGVGAAAGTILAGFAGGGNMRPNQWGIVGENGPELIRAGTRGATVVPNGMGHTFNMTFIIQGGGLGQNGFNRTTEAQVQRQMMRMVQKAGLSTA